MILNRLNITGDIDYYTPKIVLEEIADSFGIRRNYDIVLLKNKINKKLNNNKISNNYENNSDSLRIIARYVNSQCKNWKRETLLKAFTILNNMINKNYTYIEEIGLQTPENIYSLNACVLYRLCNEYSIIVDFYTSFEKMRQQLNLYFSIKYSPKIQNEIQLKIYEKIRLDFTPEDLVNIANLFNIFPNMGDKEENRENRERYTYEDYNRCAENILNFTERERRDAKNNLEAIVMSAIYEKIDLTECEAPLTEYKLMLKKPYFPNDKGLIERFKLRKDHIRNPYLNQNFNPTLPENMYSQMDLISLIGQEGIYNTDDYYTTLQTAYLSETFLHGRQCQTQNEYNTFLEKINDLDYDQIVIFGIRNSNFNGYTYAELTDTFSSYKRFIDPITNCIFTDESIEKLYLLTQRERGENESEEIYHERLDLGEEIERIKIYIKSRNKYVEEFLERYENLEDDGKKKVEIVLYNLLNTSMYMRNWDGVGDYPLSSESTNFEPEKQIIVDDRVTQSLIDFENSIRDLQKFNKLGDFILNLPLMQYHSESNSFVTSNDEGEGLTIRDRIRIVRAGENEGMNSCIRLSSNKFCATSYFYMVLLGFRLPFSIGEVSTIF